MPAENIVCFERRVEVRHDPDLRTLLIWSAECPVPGIPIPCIVEWHDGNNVCPYYVATIVNEAGANVHCACSE